MGKMKKMIPLFLMILAMTGCNGTKDQSVDKDQVIAPEVESVTGYIEIKDNQVYLDEVEIVTLENEARIKELGLIAENDLPNGYYIYNSEVEVVELELTGDTSYTFTDARLLYIKDDGGNRLYETTNKQEFMEGSSYQEVALEEQKIPYFLTICEGKINSITEEFIYTQ